MTAKEEPQEEPEEEPEPVIIETVSEPEEPEEPEITDAEYLDEVEVRVIRDRLEYSNKDTDPLKLVRVDDKDVEISTDDQLDLSTTGEQTILYTLAYGEALRYYEQTFVIEDTKAPAIRTEENRTVEYGTDFDPMTMIQSVRDVGAGDLPYGEGDQGSYTLEGDFDPETPGTYTFTVHAADNHGNTSKKSFSVTVKEPPKPVEPEVTEKAEEYAEPRFDYIANANTGKFHIPSCRSVKQMKESNKVFYYDVTREEMLNMGYDPCKNCDP
jgi:hypothetical protein